MVSFNVTGYSCTGWSGGSYVMIKFSRLACFPAYSLTPDASYITTSANTKHMANRSLLVPSLTPTAVVRPTTSDVWDDGIPPLPTTLVHFHSLVAYQWVNNLAI